MRPSKRNRRQQGKRSLPSPGPSMLPVLRPICRRGNVVLPRVTPAAVTRASRRSSCFSYSPYIRVFGCQFSDFPIWHTRPACCASLRNAKSCQSGHGQIMYVCICLNLTRQTPIGKLRKWASGAGSSVFRCNPRQCSRHTLLCRPQNKGCLHLETEEPRKPERRRGCPGSWCYEGLAYRPR
jgi:hypothetical protein